MRDIDRKLKHWLERALPVVAGGEADHIHIDELWKEGSDSAEAMVRGIKEPYLRTIQLLANHVDTVMPVLVIPLKATRRFTRRWPSPSEIPKEMSGEPPSIYVVPRGAAALELAERYRTFLPDFDFFDAPRDDVKFFYEISRGEKERRWNWEYTRQIVGEHYSAKHRTGWYSAEV